MVDGVTPHMDSGKPGGSRPPKGSSYVKQEVEFRPAGKGNHTGKPAPKNRPYNGPSFGRNTYSDSDEAAGQGAPSNSNSAGGSRGSRSMDGLSDSGGSTEEPGGQGFPSRASSQASPNRKKEEESLGEQGQEEVQEETAGSEEGESTSETSGESTGASEGAETAPESTGPASDAKKQERANRYRRAQDNSGVKPSEVVKDPTQEGMNKRIELVFGKGEIGNLAKKLWANGFFKWLVLTCGPFCCCSIILAIVMLVVYTQMSPITKFFLGLF